MHYFVRLDDGEPIELDTGPEGLTLGDESLDAELHPVEGTDTWVLRMGPRVHRIVARRAEGQGRWDLLVDGVPVRAEALDSRTRHLREMTSAMAGASGPKPVVAPMPGLVMKIDVEEGDVVEEGDGVVIVEAMKMENELVAEGAGRAVRIAVSEGDAVEKGQVLVEFEALEQEGEEDA